MKNFLKFSIIAGVLSFCAYEIGKFVGSVENNIQPAQEEDTPEESQEQYYKLNSDRNVSEEDKEISTNSEVTATEV